MLRLRTYILLIVLLGLLLYIRGLFNGFIDDDLLQIVWNTKVHSITNLPSFFSSSTYETGGSTQTNGLFYRPLMMSTFSLLYTLFGPNPLFFHLLQIIVHITNAILIFLFFRYFFKEPPSFIFALIFLVHPINSETALYSANLQDVLFFFFGMIALLLIQHKKSSKSNILLVSGAILCSLFSKESGILFLVIIPLYSYFFNTKTWRIQSLIGSLIVTSAIYLFFRYALAHMYAANTSLVPISSASLGLRLINIPEIFFYYLRMFFYPMTMSSTQYWIITSVSVWNFWIPLFLALLFCTLILVGFLWTRKKHRKNQKIYLFFMLWFFLGLLLHLQIIPLDTTVADRWFYFPGVGLLALILISFEQIPLMKMKHTRLVFVYIGVVVILLLSIRTFIRIGDWQTPLTLFSHEIMNSPRSFILDNQYGQALISNDQFTKAKPYVERSIREHPFPSNLNNMAIIYTSMGETKKANEYFNKAIAQGQNFSVYENYANFLLYYKSPEDALTFSHRAIKVFPQSARILLVIAQSAYLTDNKKEALAAAAKSYEIQPDEQTLQIFTTIQQNKPLKLKHL